MYSAVDIHQENAMWLSKYQSALSKQNYKQNINK